VTDTDRNGANTVKKPKPGTFSTHNQPKRRRSSDRIPLDVKAGVIEGLAAHGEDGQGLNGFPGWVLFMARKHPKSAARLAERLLPPSVVVANNSSTSSGPIHTVNIVSIPGGTFLSQAELARLNQPQLTIEHEPQLEHAEPEQIEEPAAIEAQSPEEARLIAELEGLSYDELLQRAGVSNVDQG
jgi:hypothetical protein